jgi:hypothetical protein
MLWYSVLGQLVRLHRFCSYCPGSPFAGGQTLGTNNSTFLIGGGILIPSDYSYFPVLKRAIRTCPSVKDSPLCLLHNPLGNWCVTTSRKCPSRLRDPSSYHIQSPPILFQLARRPRFMQLVRDISPTTQVIPTMQLRRGTRINPPDPDPATQTHTANSVENGGQQLGTSP